MKEEILKKLNLHEIKKSKVEKDLGMPQNSLSAMLSGKKEIPSKWVKPLTEYIEKLDNPQEPKKELQISPEIKKLEVDIEKPTESEWLELKKIAETNNSFGFVYGEKLDKFEITPKQLVGDSNSKFDQLLKQFNELIDLTDKPKDIKLKLEQIKETAKNSNLTPRQTDAIIDRCNNQLENKYNTSKHSLKLS